jgi:glycosyltransferase involved in cell wall biosynthesis
VIAHSANRGHIATYNDGLAAVETEYVTLLSADDLAAPGAFARATALMEARPRVGLVYGRPLSFWGEPPGAMHKRIPTTWSVWRGHEWIRLASFRGRNFILSPEVIMRTRAVFETGGYNAELPHSADLEYWLRTASRWDVGHINGRVQAYYRHHETNMHEISFGETSTDLLQRAHAFGYLGSDSFIAISSEGARLERRARGAIVRETLGLARRELDRSDRVDSALELRSIALELSSAPVSRRRLRGLDRRLFEVASDRGPTAGHVLRRSVTSAAVAVKWRVWSYAGVS